MHLKIFILVTLVALGTAARQSWKSINSIENGNKHWEKESNYAKKLPRLNINYGNSQKNVLYPRKDMRKLESPTQESVEPKLEILQKQARSIGNSVKPDARDLDLMSARISEDIVNEDSFGETAPLFPTPSGSYPKKHFDTTKKFSKPAEDWANEEWNLIQQKLKDIYNVLTLESQQSIPTKSQQSIPTKSQQSIPTKSQQGASDLAESRSAEKVKHTSDSENLVKVDDCAGRSHFKLPFSRKALTSDGYQYWKNDPKCSSDRMPKLYPERSNVESLDQELYVHEGSTEISALSAKLARIEERLAEISELLLHQVEDEPV